MHRQGWTARRQNNELFFILDILSMGRKHFKKIAPSEIRFHKGLVMLYSFRFTMEAWGGDTTI